MKILLKLLAGLIALSVIAVVGVFGYLRFGLPPSQFAGTCEALPLDGSAEDIEVDHERGLAYLSLIDRMTLVQGGAAQGTIAALDLKGPERTVVSALIDKPDHFRPHGISIYKDAAGLRHLFVINHPVNRGDEPEQVELFVDEGSGRFRHVATYSDPLFSSPNDLAAVGPQQFYIANDDDSAAANLVYFDGQRARVVASDIASGGGINTSSDGSKVYVAETRGKTLRVMQRDRVDGGVTTEARIDLNTSPDNIDVAPDGSLWIGAHSSILGLVMHFMAGTDAPSQVLRVQLDSDNQAAIEQIYMNRGDEISASSVGATYGNQLLIGSITSRKIAMCDMAD